MNILIVDDEAVSSTVLKQLVAKLPDCEAHTFTDPSAALIWCSQNAADLAIVDYSMPTIDGIEFTVRLRNLPNARAIPVVMVSAVRDMQVVERALRNGVNDFIHKPFDFIELQTCVSHMLGLQAMRGQLANKTLLASARALSRTNGKATRVVDRDVSRARLGGNQELFDRVVQILSATVPTTLRAIHTSVFRGDFDAVLADTIMLKGAVAAVEAPEMLDLLSRLEQHARTRDPLATVAAFATVQAAIEALLRELAALAPERSDVVDRSEEDASKAGEIPASSSSSRSVATQ